jgi:hypothetical protein
MRQVALQNQRQNYSGQNYYSKRLIVMPKMVLPAKIFCCFCTHFTGSRSNRVSGQKPVKTKGKTITGKTIILKI